MILVNCNRSTLKGGKKRRSKKIKFFESIKVFIYKLKQQSQSQGDKDRVSLAVLDEKKELEHNCRVASREVIR